MGVPTKPNKTGIATAADKVYTKQSTAEWIINYYNPQGSILEPAAGKNAFFNLFKNEFDRGKQFVESVRNLR